MIEETSATENDKIRDGYYKIRPAGRHIVTIGRDLIKDKYAAIVELVKNAYDADSPSCKISLLPFQKATYKGIKIIIKDEGHGMTYDTVVNKWMVPSTDDKFNRVNSPKGRLMQGKKGIGRYSASMIGEDLVLQTIDETGDLTTLYLIWQHFEQAKYLEDVDVLIENFKTNKTSGTEIIIIGDENHLNEWSVKQIQNLKFELKKLIPPVDKKEFSIDSDTENFEIHLELGDFPFDGFANTVETIEPYPLFDLFDYRISGVVLNDGTAKLKFDNNRIHGFPQEEINEFRILLNQDPNRRNEEAYCGDVKIDFRVFDRDPNSIDSLIGRGLKDPITGHYVGRREARVILDTFNGVGVYRNGFRLRPLGDAGYDWLELDRERVQNPSLKIGSDQVIGFIHIKSENESGLEEKSARDGLKETAQYFGLQEICKQILRKLEERRFIYRQSQGLGRNTRDINEKIKVLYDFKDVKEKINNELIRLGIAEEKRTQINKILSEKEDKNNKIADDLKNAIALYQGQATIGKIVNVILHEGRKPLGYFKNQIPVLTEWAEEIREKYDQELLEKIVARLSTVKEQSNIFIKLFEKLDPLSAKKRGQKRDFYLKKVFEDVKGVFETELLSQNIEYVVDCFDDASLYGWEEDLYIILTNLIDNSVYWLQSINDRKKKINIKVVNEENVLIIEYTDNGPGIEAHLIESEIIFDPEFSSKSGGTGLGLAISGEAIGRNDGELKVIHSNSGAFFKLEFKIIQ